MHLLQVFSSARKLVLAHSTDHDGGRTAHHVLWRRWTPEVEARFPQWELVEQPDDPTAIDFYLFRFREI
jgi:hypothetical protein